MEDLRSLIYRDYGTSKLNLLEPFYMSMSESKEVNEWPSMEELLKKQSYVEGSAIYFTEKIMEDIGKEYTIAYKMLLLVESLVAVSFFNLLSCGCWFHCYKIQFYWVCFISILKIIHELSQ